MIRLPDGLTVEGFIQRATEAERASRILTAAGRPPETLEQRCRRVEQLQEHVDRILKEGSSL